MIDGIPARGPSIFTYFWVNYNDLTATSLGIMVSQGNHPQMALFQVSEILKSYPDIFAKRTWLGWFMIWYGDLVISMLHSEPDVYRRLTKSATWIIDDNPPAIKRGNGKGYSFNIYIYNVYIYICIYNVYVYIYVSMGLSWAIPAKLVGVPLPRLILGSLQHLWRQDLAAKTIKSNVEAKPRCFFIVHHDLDWFRNNNWLVVWNIVYFP